METITINGKEFDISALSEEAKAQITSLQYVKSEIQRLEAQIAVFKTAEAGYSNALQKELDFD